MTFKTKEITEYFRSAVAAQSNKEIDFKNDNFQIVQVAKLLQGKIDLEDTQKLFAEANKKASEYEDEDESKKKAKEKTLLNVIICAKTIKTIFEANEKVQDERDELTGFYFIPALLKLDGTLLFNGEERKLPWFPREFLTPMVEPKLAIGRTEAVDDFMSNQVDQAIKIKAWREYVEFFKMFYEKVTDSQFEQNTIRNLDEKEPYFELENNVYVFLDKTVFTTFHIMNLYNDLQKDEQPKALYDNFLSLKIPETSSLIQNTWAQMKVHCGQMGGEYPLSQSQRETVNHFNSMTEAEILAVNGPPGTGKTTLLQSIVADMYVKRALQKERAPVIVTSSTNNQAVTNIIASFGNIKKMDLANLEERWIEGVDSFAVYFPAASKRKEAESRGYQYTDQNGKFFVAKIEDKENLKKSKLKLMESCNKYFDSAYKDIDACQSRLHEELKFLDDKKETLLELVQEISELGLNGEPLDDYIHNLEGRIKHRQEAFGEIRRRVQEWEDCFKKIPLIFRLLRFIKMFARKIQTEFRLFINEDEQGFLNEYMSLDEIKETYSYKSEEYKKILAELKKNKEKLEQLKGRYDHELDQLKHHNISLPNKGESKYRLDPDYINGLLDTKVRYVEFWLAVHYFECRWVQEEDRPVGRQGGKTFKNTLDMFYHRLSMIAPCFVMTFFTLPKQFRAYGDQKHFYLFNFIDLLIVDEAGQVSPEIAAGAFSLAKKAVAVGDIHQIEPVWAVNRALDKALAFSNRAIPSLNEFELLERTGLNSSCSSVMKVAAQCCKYIKFNERGLFLREHRRCYNEIIAYSNELVYKGNLDPMRGEGKCDPKLPLKQWPQMGHMQIESEYSVRKNSSRLNPTEAKQIAAWLKINYAFIIDAYPGELQENLVGIITPFKAQVQVIRAELKKALPDYDSKISVGTVHTFQGAERRIIILSTVYGKQDGCYFIDANESLMNVAVSRAKDHFFVFGDINCLQGPPKSASGLLRRYIGSNTLG
ncbi:putative DNA helicase [Syntrophobotulus glycolicus DSM 8271]|uniref:DNA helicase n=1 Tax=Syntrophobotulus glycolicus (strain DSM 8271 / FlGlyR) TaxID=645991 RepID=F0STV4_SYNGF|nr:AAA domain-containing protein [Syntrophobotulus glycolicus]ADY55394.1 putative DNA helicase [Syntrophobotulus glycolicus DSM 8271]